MVQDEVDSDVNWGVFTGYSPHKNDYIVWDKLHFIPKF